MRKKNYLFYMLSLLLCVPLAHAVHIDNDCSDHHHHHHHHHHHDCSELYKPNCKREKTKIRFDVKHKDIGLKCSKNPKHHECCLEPETFPGYSTKLYYNSAVEPSIAVNPKKKSHVTAAWQQDVFSDGGALDIVIAYSHNGGKHWRYALVPFQNCNHGFSQRVTDCWLSYSRDGERLYLVALVFNASTDPNTENQEGIVVSVSHDDGEHWSIPHYVAASTNSLQSGCLLLEKPSVTADPCFKHHAYVVWDSFGIQCPVGCTYNSQAYISITTDGGKCWSDNALLYDPFPDLFNTNLSNGNPNDAQVTDNTIVGLPNGDLLNFMTRIYAKPGVTDAQFVADRWPFQYTAFDIAFVRSTDHGKHWDETATIVATMDANEVWTCGYNYNIAGQIESGNGQPCRTESPYFSVTVNPYNGNLYVAWQTSQFGSPNNLLPQIALIASRDGGYTWSNPVKVNKTPPTVSNPQAFTPSIAINNKGHLGLLYHDFRKANPGCHPKTKTNTWFALYKETPHSYGGNTGIGLDFKHEVQLSEHSYMMEDGPFTTTGALVDGDDIGFMVNGDYERLVVLEDDFHAIYIQTHRGPFKHAHTVIDSPDEGILVVDHNRRTSPYFSKIDG